MKIAIISDMHCCHSKSKNGTNDSYLTSDLLRTPPERHHVQSLIKTIRDEKLIADVVLVLGDLTNKLDTQGFISAWGFVNEIAKELNAQLVIPTLGNHDVNWMKTKKTTNTNAAPHDELAKNIAPSFPYSDQQLKDEFFANGFVHIAHKNWHFLVFNSAFNMQTEKEAERGELSAYQISHAQNKINHINRHEPKVFILHHHPILHEDVTWHTSDITNGAEAFMKLVETSIPAVVMHGHKHQARLTGLAVPVFAAGSFSAIPKGNLAGHNPNMFHLADLEMIDNTICGSINTWIHETTTGWFQDSASKTRFPCKCGFGCTMEFSAIINKLILLFANESSLEWTEAIKKIPQLRYLSPKQLEKLTETLITKNFKVFPSAVVPPEVILKIKQEPTHAKM